MTRYHLTKHAQHRKQQRGISDLQIELIRIFGEDHLQGGGTTLSYISERQLTQLRQAIDRMSGVTLVKSPSETVVTIMHATRRISTTEFVA